jgi:plant G-box-binding factor
MTVCISLIFCHCTLLHLLQTKQQIKRLRRQQSNRESARRSRQRKAEEANMLAHRVGEMEVMNGALQTKNATLETEVQQLRSIIDMMASDSSTLAAQVGPATHPFFFACLTAVRHFLHAATYQQCSYWWEIQTLCRCQAVGSAISRQSPVDRTFSLVSNVCLTSCFAHDLLLCCRLASLAELCLQRSWPTSTGWWLPAATGLATHHTVLLAPSMGHKSHAHMLGCGDRARARESVLRHACSSVAE